MGVRIGAGATPEAITALSGMYDSRCPEAGDRAPAPFHGLLVLVPLSSAR